MDNCFKQKYKSYSQVLGALIDLNYLLPLQLYLGPSPTPSAVGAGAPLMRALGYRDQGAHPATD